MFGHLPPPYFGPSTGLVSLLHSDFAQHFDVTVIDLTVVRGIGELEEFRITKLFKLAGIVGKELYHLLTRRFDLCCYPISVNRNAFLKDAGLLAVARLFAVPTVLYAHGNNLPDFYEHSTPWVKRVFERTVRQAAGAIVQGECLRFNFEPWLPPERIFVVPAGYEPSKVPPRARGEDGQIRVLYLGAMVREKGVFVILEAATKIAARRPDVRFVFVGAWFRAEQEAAAKQFIADHQLGEQVTLLGPVSNEVKWQTLVDADMLVFPTFYYYETMGGVLLEAMQAGLPVIATRRASIPEIIQDGVQGLLIKEQDPDELAEKILRLADDPALRAKMGAAGRQRFDGYYTHEHYGRRMIGVFDQLVAHRGR